MAKFLKNLTASNKSIKDSRAKLIAEDAEQACRDLVLDIEKQIRDLKRTLMNLEDLSPDSALSLKPVSGDFDAIAWAKKINETKIELKLKQIDLDIAKETLTEYFGDEEV